jgi:uncharacterized protein
MPVELFQRYRVIDVDTHLTEPPDLWTSRVSSKWGEAVPHVENVRGTDIWMADGTFLNTPGQTAIAGWDGYVPNGPRTYDEIPPSAYDAAARLAHMDEEGIYAQVLYPNVAGFGSGYFLRLGDRELVTACVRAYNDFLVEWASADPSRLIPVMSTPFWDLDFAVTELERCVENGHKGVNFCNHPDSYGEPSLSDPHWDPLWAAAQDAGVPITFHIGGGDISAPFAKDPHLSFEAKFPKISALMILDNIETLADLVFGGVCHRFPELRFVSVESGVGWLPGVLETFDWQWGNSAIRNAHPEYDLLPSEYFRRQIYGCFWFEEDAARFTIEQFPDNVLFETDFPHPTCQHPGPASIGAPPGEYATKALDGLADDVVARVLHDNAAKLYGLA